MCYPREERREREFFFYIQKDTVFSLTRRTMTKTTEMENKKK